MSVGQVLHFLHERDEYIVVDHMLFFHILLANVMSFHHSLNVLMIGIVLCI
jgi:hypothetical protein